MTNTSTTLAVAAPTTTTPYRLTDTTLQEITS